MNRSRLSPCLLLLFAVPASAQMLQIREWTVPWELTRPRDPYVGAGGDVWFVGQTGDYVARLSPNEQEFRRYALDPGTGPHNLIVDAHGTVWYAGNRAAHIGRLDPSDGSITKLPMPDPAATDPHTLVFDRRGRIWFTVQHGNFVGRLDPARASIELIAVPTADARPYGIVIAGDGKAWVAEFGTNKIAVVDPESMQLSEIELPRRSARPRRIATTTDGHVWYVDYADGMLGRYDPGNGEFREWPAPAAERSRPYGMAVDAEDRVWFVETGVHPNQMVVFDTRTTRFVANEAIPSGAGAVRHMMYDAARDEVWFGTDANTVGRGVLQPGNGAEESADEPR